MKFFFILVLSIFLLSGSLKIFATGQFQNSNFQISIFKDIPDTLEVDEVKMLLNKNSRYFVPADSSTEPFSHKAAYWLYIQSNDSNIREQFVLSFHLWVSHVEVYPFPYTSVSGYGGRMVPGKLKALSGNNILLKPGVTRYLVKVQNRIYSVASAKNFEIKPLHTFLEKKEKDNLVHGIIIGFLWLMLIYNTIFYILNKKRLHLFYVLYVFLNSLFIFFAFNYSEIFLFPRNYLLNHVLLTSQLIGAFFYAMFIRTAMLSHCTKYTPALDRRTILPFAYFLLAVNIIIGSTAFFRMDIYMIAQGLSNLVGGTFAICMFAYCYRSSDWFMRTIAVGSVILFLFGWTNVVYVIFFIGSFNMFYEVGLTIELLIFTYALNWLHYEEKHKAEVQKIQLERELENKNRELVYKVIQLSAKEEAIISINEQIKAMNSSDKQNGFTATSTLLNNSMNENLWKEFEVHFTETHPVFYKELMNKFPELTQSEIRLCAFLKLNLNTKEIASITRKSARSIEVMRSRIRQKMNLDRDDSLSLMLTKL